jgi:hypothetical protein
VDSVRDTISESFQAGGARRCRQNPRAQFDVFEGTDKFAVRCANQLYLLPVEPAEELWAGYTTGSEQDNAISRYWRSRCFDQSSAPRTVTQSWAIHAYRAHKDASKEQRALLEIKRGRKRSWVGVDDQKPYAYLREAMVSGLMDGICKVGGTISHSTILEYPLR